MYIKKLVKLFKCKFHSSFLHAKLLYNIVIKLWFPLQTSQKFFLDRDGTRLFYVLVYSKHAIRLF